MSNLWFIEGLRKGIKTESYPRDDPEMAPLWPSVLAGSGSDQCPVDAITDKGWVKEKCIFCRRCLPHLQPTGNQDLFAIKNGDITFRRSFNIFPLDTGACGACNVEFQSLFSPQYDANRLGIFLVNSPRHADAIVIMGVMTQGMKDALQRAYDAIPEPKLVIALGACAVTGGVMGEPPLDRSKYNVEIAGCPPSPYTILSALHAAKTGNPNKETVTGKDGGENKDA